MLMAPPRAPSNASPGRTHRLDLQTNFERLLHMCMRQAKRVHAIELMTYFEGVYKTKGASRMYIGTLAASYAPDGAAPYLVTPLATAWCAQGRTSCVT